MDHKFLDYYNRELTFMREMASEFAQKHPKIASRLGVHGIDVADPFVERLIESFSFIAARMQLKLDAEFPTFTQRLLDVIYPNYNAPTPSIGVVQLRPNLKEGDLTLGYEVAKNSAFFTSIFPGETTRCEFRSGQSVRLWPLTLCDARMTSLPPDLPNLERHRIAQSELKGALRLRLQLPEGMMFSDLTELASLPVYLSGDERIVSRLFELLHGGCQATILRHAKEGGWHDAVISQQALLFEGMSVEKSLLPVNWNIFHGHNLVNEYFACRQRFYFFTLNHLSAGIADNHSRELEVILLLNQMPQDLAGHIDTDRFQLFCTPVINLFPRRVDRLEVKRNTHELHVVPDRSRPLDYEIHSILRVTGQQAEHSKEVVFNPLFQTRHSDSGNFGRYFSLTRRQRTGSHSLSRKYHSQTLYNGTEVFISLVDQQEAPFSDDIRYLSVEAMVTNRDLPRLIARTGQYDLTISDAAPVHGARFISPPSSPRAPFVASESAWRLIRQLNFNYQPLSDRENVVGGEAFRQMLQLFVDNTDHDAQSQISGLIGCETVPVIRRLPGNGLLMYGRGVKCTLTMDEENFSGVSPYLFGLVLENYLARHASINVFTETELRTIQRGKIARWQPRPGRRGAL
ncbi:MULTISPECIES: type VI secretion system baseplate subunit TssF [Lelliottia]|uniref:Type VI secretion system baseplate subunit TssF n=1 Tax=Lelliottia wanjuensis TaxID=3050585 RepID=A0AAP4D540_9ENTR|nr:MULTISPECIES: type VI secretion system baseplate subunit TssF [unclassified Lelliottia]MDK9361828.1 type VI secretion system baseplate subunit TssF [Lelliottia sp. V106_12]MDK9582980.1 type VI secretion system baseplate subunit TssF [Lelliottia sp. V86_10]MDK9618561.1 type VI secretion system baseplate subunit TssF [Lelliottia sp. V106_9]